MFPAPFEARFHVRWRNEWLPTRHTILQADRMECASNGGLTDVLACFLAPEVSHLSETKPLVVRCHECLEMIGGCGAKGTRSSRTFFDAAVPVSEYRFKVSETVASPHPTVLLIFR